jgi:hypothetical protein
MRTIFVLLLLFFIPSAVTAQVTFSEEVKVDSYQTAYVGSTESHAYYVSGKTYVKIPFSTGIPEVIILDDPGFKGLNCYRGGSAIVNNEMVEVYNGSSGNFDRETEIFIVKRNLDDFSIIGSERFLHSQKVWDGLTTVFVWIKPDATGFYLIGDDAGYDNACYVKRFDLALNELWSINTDKFYAGDKPAVQAVLHNNRNGSLTYVLNLQKCTDCGMFQRDKAIEGATLAFLIFGPSGGQKVFIPTFTDPLIYSNSHFIFNEKDSTLVGVYETHEMGKNQYDQVSGMGYAYYKWDLASGEQISRINKQFTYGDLLGPDGEAFLKTVSQNLNVPKEQKAPKITTTANYFELENGELIVAHRILSGNPQDPNFHTKTNAAIAYSSFIFKLNSSGEIEWTKLHGNVPGQRTYFMALKNNSDLILLGTDIAKTSSADGSIKAGKETYVHTVINLNEGVSTATTAFALLDKYEYNELTEWSDEAGVYIIARDKDAGVTTVQYPMFGMLRFD